MTTTAEERIRVAGSKLVRALSRVDDKRPEEIRSLSMAQLRCLFYVASKEPPVRLSEVWRALDLAGSTGQRSLSLLGDHSMRNSKSPSLGLVKVEMDPTDRRERVIELTAMGRFVMESIAADIVGP